MEIVEMTRNFVPPGNMKLIVRSSSYDGHCAELQALLQIIEQHLTCSLPRLYLFV